ncbi:uncharacterized protein LOC131659671 [Vicia villosa]|uniref:uncharacterized protein LOC131659671 n=1 Tax=Vicia villosa TaxID=3911 RepID=UPI00273A83C2|nr:uncharacterized protein LOC131659671 [Vicia villosa]
MSLGDPFDLSRYVTRKYAKEDVEFQEFCGELLRTLQENGAALVYDPRYTRKQHFKCINLMEDFFAVHPNFAQESHPQLRIPVDFSETEVSETPLEYLPTPGLPALPSEFHWSIGMRPTVTQFPILNQKWQNVPHSFSPSNWKDKFDGCGDKLLDTLRLVAELLAFGYRLPRDTFSSFIHMGPHFLVASGLDLRDLGDEGTLLSPCQCDSTFLSIQAGNMFPGLNMWAKSGRKVEVAIPDGCLLVQTGKQIEWMTAGSCKASRYERVLSKKVIDAINLARTQDRKLWSVSSKLYAQVATDVLLKPVASFAGSADAKNYPAILAGEVQW